MNVYEKLYSMNLISFLRYKGLEEYDADIDSNGKVYFLFEKNEELEKAKSEYKEDHVKVELHPFTSQYKEVRREIRRHKQNLIGGSNEW